MTILEALKFLAEHLDAKAIGIAILREDGSTGYATLVAHDPTKARADPALFGRLSDELYKCALEAATAATHGERQVS